MKTVEISNIQAALTALGVTENTLSEKEKQALDAQGYLLLPSVLNKKRLEELWAEFERCCSEKREDSGQTTKQERGTRHVNFPLEANPAVEWILTYPKLLASAHHIFKREFRLNGAHGRDPLPGFGQQGLHADWNMLAPGEEYQVVTAIWYLDEATPETGSTRLVPGSHRFGFKPDKRSLAPTSVYPGQIQVTAKAGSLLIFNGHLWHSGSLNKSQHSRRSIICAFGGRENRWFGSTESETLPQLSPAMRYLLDK